MAKRRKLFFLTDSDMRKRSLVWGVFLYHHEKFFPVNLMDGLQFVLARPGCIFHQIWRFQPSLYHACNANGYV